MLSRCDGKDGGRKECGEEWEDEQTWHFKYAALHFSETAETNMGNKCREEGQEQEPKKTSPIMPCRIPRHPVSPSLSPPSSSFILRVREGPR